jgi:DNA polymerase
MVVVADPEDGAGELLGSSPQGKLFAGIIDALGLDDSQVYVASALPRPTPLPDWQQLAADGLGAVVAHHAALVAPKRLLVFGSGVSSLLGHDPANKHESSPIFHHDRGSLPLLAAMDLAALLARPRAKAGLWQRLLDWTGTTET